LHPARDDNSAAVAAVIFILMKSDPVFVATGDQTKCPS